MVCQVPQIRPLADIVHYKYIFTYLLTYLLESNNNDNYFLKHSRLLAVMTETAPHHYIWSR